MIDLERKEQACRSLLEKQNLINAHPQSVSAYVLRKTEYNDFAKALGTDLTALLSTLIQTTGDFFISHINISGIHSVLASIASEKKKRGKMKKFLLGTALAVISIVITVIFGLVGSPKTTTNTQNSAPIINGDMHGNITIAPAPTVSK